MADAKNYRPASQLIKRVGHESTNVGHYSSSAH